MKNEKIDGIGKVLKISDFNLGNNFWQSYKYELTSTVRHLRKLEVERRNFNISKCSFHFSFDILEYSSKSRGLEKFVSGQIKKKPSK